MEKLHRVTSFNINFGLKHRLKKRNNFPENST